MGEAWQTGQNENVINVASGFSSVFSLHGSEHEEKGRREEKEIRRAGAPSGKNNSSPEFSTVNSTSGSQ